MAAASRKESTVFGGLTNLFFALLILGVMYYFYTTIESYENGEEIEMNILLFFAYKVLGKTIASGIMGLVALIYGYLGISQIVAANKK